MHDEVTLIGAGMHSVAERSGSASECFPITLGLGGALGQEAITDTRAAHEKAIPRLSYWSADALITICAHFLG